MNKSIFILFLLLSIYTFSQSTFNSESYTVSRGDLETNVYPKDSTANALVLYEFGNTFVDKHEFNFILEEKQKKKILNKEGFKHATITLYLRKNVFKNLDETIEDIIGYTYNLENGEMVKTRLSEENIFRYEFNDDYNVVKFTLPKIKEGSVITYSYKIISPSMFNFRGWTFQGEIPRLYSEYRTSIPENLDYNIKLIGSKKLFSNTSDIELNCLDIGLSRFPDCSNFTYIMKDIPAFIEEKYMTSKTNYLSRLDFRLKTFINFKGYKTDYTKTWKNVDRELREDENIGLQLKKSVSEKDLLPSSILTETNTLKKATAIFEHVQKNYSWNNEYHIFKDVSIKELIESKSGNVSSINILLHNLLKACDIDVKPILLSTRDNGFATKIFPVIFDFNYLLLQVTIDNNSYFLDATDKFLDFGEIPFRCLNHYGRLLDLKKGSEWIDIQPKTTSSINYMATLEFDENQNLIGNIKSKSTGYESLLKRKSYYRNNIDYLDAIKNNNPNVQINNFEVSIPEENKSDFLESYNVNYNLQGGKNNLYINPFLIVFFKENPFKLQERTHPIDFGYKKSFLYIANIELGDFYEIIEKPKDVIISLPNNKGLMTFTTKIIDDKINIMFRFNFKSTLYEPEYYPFMKEFMSKIVDIQTNSLILLKRK